MNSTIQAPWMMETPSPASMQAGKEEKSKMGLPAHPPSPAAGEGRDVILQGFHWDSHNGVFENGKHGYKRWYRIIEDNASAIRAAGFTWMWFPPASDSLAPQGYIPRRWNVLDTAFGTEAELRTAIEAIAPVKALADVVVNHRVGVATSGPDFEDPR